MKYILIAAFSLFIFSCNSNSGEQRSDAQDTVAGTTTEAGKQVSGIRQVSFSNGTVVFVSEEHPIGASLSDVKIYSGKTKDTIFVKDADPVSAVLHGDLDKDGFGEIYIVTTAAGSGSYGNIIGAASEGDSVLREIRFPAVDTKVKTYEGYMGGDSFMIDGDALVRSFPVYKPEDSNNNPTGGTRMVKYRLLKKGNNFLLLESKP